MKASEKASKRADLEAQLKALEEQKEEAEEVRDDAKAGVNPEAGKPIIGHPKARQDFNEYIVQASEDTIATLVEEIRELRKQLKEAKGEETGEGSVEDEHTGADGDRGFFGNIWGGRS
jgi:hypothetical protein